MDIMDKKPSTGNKFIYRYFDNDGSYIGQTKKSLKQRAGNQGKNYLTSDNKWSRAIIEKGFDHFNVEILCECSENEADKQEKYFIEKFDSRKTGYNSTPGGKWYNPYYDYKNNTRDVYEWVLDESTLSENAKKINRILCEEFKVDSAKKFDGIWFYYGYYAFGGDYENYSISLALLIDNFHIYPNAEKIINSFEEEVEHIRKINESRSQLINYYLEHISEFKVDDYGTVLVSDEQAQKLCQERFGFGFDPKTFLLKQPTLFDYLVNSYCPQHECLGGDLITSGEVIY